MELNLLHIKETDQMQTLAAKEKAGQERLLCTLAFQLP